MSVANNTATADGKPLVYTEINADNGKDTILFIHGALSTGDDWDLVTPHLSPDYHLLLPDLPGHGRSRDILPFSTQLSARLLADLIREKAHNGKAHIVGFSLGAIVAMQLVSKYPNLINAVFVSGFGAISAPQQAIASVLWLQDRALARLPRPALHWLMDGADVRPSDPSIGTFALCRSIAQGLSGDEWPAPWPARTLIVAAGKSGLLPTADSTDAAKRLREIASRVQPAGQTRAYTHLQMRHPWCMQAPELFAQTARKWFESSSVPDGFEEL